MMQFASVANVNSLFWITSLEEDKQGTTRRVIEDLEPFFHGIGLLFQVFEPKSAEELEQILRLILSAAESGGKPIIHFDTHGDADSGIFIATSKEFVSWHRLYTLLRPINVATGNNLCVVSAACYSIRMIKQISIMEACPFYLMLAPQDTVSFGFVEQATVAFYKDIFQDENILEAYEKHFTPDLSVFHSEKMLAIVMARYFKFKCMGSGGRERREGLLTEAINSGTPNNRRNRRIIRSTAKSEIRPSPEIMAKYGPTFLCGKKVPFSFEDIMKFITGAEESKDPLFLPDAAESPDSQ